MEGTVGLSVLWPSWMVLPAMICVVPRSSSPPTESVSSFPYRLLLFFFLPFGTEGFRLGLAFFVIVVGVVFADKCSSGYKRAKRSPNDDDKTIALKQYQYPEFVPS